MITAPDAAASITSELRDPADAGVQDVEARPRVVRQLRDLVLERLERAGRRRPSARGSAATACALLDPLEDVLEADRTPHAPRQRLGLQPDRALARRDGAPRGRSSTARTGSPASGTAVEAEHLDRLAGRRLLRRGWPRKSCIARTRPQCAPATSASPVLQRAALDEDGHDRAAAGVEPRLDHGAARGRVGLAFSSSTSATSRIMSSRLSRPSLVLADTSQKIVSPPQSSGVRPCAGRARRARARAARPPCRSC